jgi:hypothetical protein
MIMNFEMDHLEQRRPRQSLYHVRTLRKGGTVATLILPDIWLARRLRIFFEASFTPSNLSCSSINEMALDSLLPSGLSRAGFRVLL